jgi:hypothetical protein
MMPTKTEYDKATPYVKGFMSYMFAKHPGSHIPERCPFKRGTKEWDEFQCGQMAGVLEAQDSES